MAREPDIEEDDFEQRRKDISDSYERGERKTVKNPKREMKNFRTMPEIHSKKIRG
jgi:hypothetical protein